MVKQETARKKKDSILTIGTILKSRAILEIEASCHSHLCMQLGNKNHVFHFFLIIGHVTNWPAEAVERSCQRINEEHLNLSNLGITRVSTELKMARSLVRLAEIQSTLHEQRTLFLRQQIQDLEEMRPRVALHHYINQTSNAEAASAPSHQSTPNAQLEQHQSLPPANITPIVSSNA